PDQRRVVPMELLQRARGHVLPGRVERLRNRVVGRLIWPVRLEDLVGPAAELELAVLAVEAVHGAAHLLVPVAERPATEGKTAARIFIGAARRLHDAVERDEGGCDELSHGATPWVG